LKWLVANVEPACGDPVIAVLDQPVYQDIRADDRVRRNWPPLHPIEPEAAALGNPEAKQNLRQMRR
jgi:hypothetical protein